jgi:hypothetical protein
MDMVTYTCDGCGVEMRRGQLRYQVKIEAKAAYDEMVIGLADLLRDHRAEMLRLIRKLENADPAEIEAQVYRHFSFDLCPRCYAAYCEAPLQFQAERPAPAPPFDVDGFLRSILPPGDPETPST